MYAWYKRATSCYVYLSDMEYFEDTLDEGSVEWNLGISRWFTRGWTLQELIAPMSVTFFASNWAVLGTKLQFCATISKITGINSEALLGKPLGTFNVAERMSWAAGRRTTRIEDVAYSLLGLFDINMPLLYGEGTRAFVRLQEQIIEMHEDYTIFAWTGDPKSSSMLAPSPDCFSERGQPYYDGMWTYAQLSPTLVDGDSKTTPGIGGTGSPPTVTSRGIKMEVPCTIEPKSIWPSVNSECIMVLCTISDGSHGKCRWLCLRLGWLTTASGAQSGAAVRCQGVVKGNSLFPAWAGELHTTIKEIYVSRKDHHEVSSDEPLQRRCSLLNLIARERFKSLPAIDSVALARRIVDRGWCSSCRTYPRMPHDWCGMDANRGDSVSFNFQTGETRLERQQPDLSTFSLDQDDLAVYSSAQQINGSSTIKDPTSFLRRLDAELRALEGCLWTVCSHLHTIPMKFLLCCCVAMANELSRTMGREAMSLSEFFTMDEFVTRVISSVTECPSVPWLTLTMSAQLKRKMDLTSSAILAAHVINIGKMLAGPDDADQNVLALAEAAYIWWHGNVIHQNADHITLLGGRIDAFRRPVDVIGQFECHTNPPARDWSQSSVDIDKWLRDGVRSWLGHAPAGDLRTVYCMLYMFYAGAQGKISHWEERRDSVTALSNIIADLRGTFPSTIEDGWP